MDSLIMQPVLMDASFIGKVLDGVTGSVKVVGAGIVAMLGLLLIIAGVMQISKAFASGGAARADWLIMFGCLFVGGILAFGGWNMVATEGGVLGPVGKNTADALGLKSSFSASISEDKPIGKGLKILADDFLLPFGKCMATCTGAILVTMCVYYVSMYFLKHQMKIGWVKLLVMVILGSCLFVNGSADECFKWVQQNGVGIFKDTVANFADGDTSGGFEFNDGVPGSTGDISA